MRSICYGYCFINTFTDIPFGEPKLIMKLFILCDDIFSFVACLCKNGIGKLLRMVSHAIVNPENITGDPMKNGKLRKGIGTHCHHGNEYGEIANNHADKDSQSHVVHVIFQIERKAILIGSKSRKEEFHPQSFCKSNAPLSYLSSLLQSVSSGDLLFVPAGEEFSCYFNFFLFLNLVAWARAPWAFRPLIPGQGALFSNGNQSLWLPAEEVSSNHFPMD
jgi:hypothetical protein